jgi:hypothetical protein
MSGESDPRLSKASFAASDEVRKGGVSVNPVVNGWLTGDMENPQVTFDPQQSETIAPVIDRDPASVPAPAQDHQLD